MRTHNMTRHHTLFSIFVTLLRTCALLLTTVVFYNLQNNATLLALDKIQNSAAATSITLTMPFDPGTLDPRKVRALSQVAACRCLFSGLMRLDIDNKPVPDIAENVISLDNGKTYTCSIHDRAIWSDGSLITAQDIKSSWLSTLKASQASPNASMLFVIKNAKKYFDGKIDEIQVGLEVIDAKTLSVELEEPCIYFPQLLTTYPFFILPQKWLQNHTAISPSSTSHTATPTPTYGPFLLEEWNINQNIRFIKNPQYRFHTSVLYDKVNFEIISDQTAFVMFENKEIDLAGSPLSCLPLDSIMQLKKEEKLLSTPMYGCYFLRVNTQKTLLQDSTVRKSLSHAIDRASIIKHVLYDTATLATQFAPPLHKDYMVEQTISAPYKELDKNKKMTLGLTFASGDRSSRIVQAIQQNLQKNLPQVTITLDPCEPKQFYSKIQQGNYDLALSSWIADYLDPNSFYSLFETKTCGTNNTGWESEEYLFWLKQSRLEANIEKRKKAFSHMEHILQEEAPIIPLYHAFSTYVCSSKARHTIRVTPLGTFDFIQTTQEK